MAKAHKLPVGDVVDRWRILERLGRGAVASVYRARDESRGRDVALKVLHPDPHEEETHSVDRLRREINLAQRIDHPAVCKIFEIGATDGLLFLVMEYVPGQALGAILKHGRLAPARAARIGRALAGGLAAAHAEEILHRDLKPGNVMVRPDDTVSILDFGYAIAPDVTRVTKRGSWVGTLAYAAPELLKNEPASVLSDVYSLGVILYESLTGELPFIGHSYGELASAVLFRELVPPSRLVVDLPVKLDRIVVRAMSREPSERFTDAGALGDALEAALAGMVEAEPTLTAVQVPLEDESTAIQEAPEDEPTAVQPRPEVASGESTAVDIEAPELDTSFAGKKTDVEAQVTLELPTARGAVRPPEPPHPDVPAPGDTRPQIPTPQAAHDRLAVHKKLADLSAGLVRERQEKGLIHGDDPALDQLEKTAQEEMRLGNWNDTIATLERALDRARTIAVDPVFLTTKVERFQTTLEEKAQPHNRDHFQGMVERARTMLDNGDLEGANQLLNRAFDTLRAR